MDANLKAVGVVRKPSSVTLDFHLKASRGRVADVGDAEAELPARPPARWSGPGAVAPPDRGGAPGWILVGRVRWKT